MKTSFIFFIFIFLITADLLTAQERYTVSGYVKEESSGELLVGVNIYVPGTQTGTITNRYGFYSISLPQGETKLTFSYAGYNEETRSFTLNKDLQMDVGIKALVELEEVEISGEKYDKNSRRVQMSIMELPVRQVEKIPALLGEKDVLKVLQLMPGVQSGSEGSSGMYVRGGGPDQNLIILDDATVYNASHLFGFFSVFNGDALKSIELIKGGFPARYGGRLSSVLDITMKDGNKRNYTGEVGVGLISSRAVIEGPIKKDTSSFLISGRRTYADLLARPFMPKDEKIGYHFHDFNAKLNYSFSRKDKIYLSGYFGQDKFFAKYIYGVDDEDEVGLRWGNNTFTFRWNHLFNNKLFTNTSIIFSRYNMKIYEDSQYGNSEYYLSYSSGIKDYGIKYDLQYHPGSSHTIRAGISSIYHIFKPSAFVVKDDDINKYVSNVDEIPSFESALYVEDEFMAFGNMRINAGLRFSHFIHKERSYFNTEPRLSASYQLPNESALKVSYARMTQPVHLLSNTGIGLPTDLWIPSTENISPQVSWQVAGGWVKDFKNPEFTLTIEGYYKKSDNVKGYKEGASFLLIEGPESTESYSWEDNLTEGQSWSYGSEILLQKKQGKLSGWLGYTLSWTQLQFDDVNFGKKYFARYDRRHDVSLVTMYELNKNLDVSATWVYGTGNAITLPVANYKTGIHNPGSSSDYYTYMQLKDYGEKNSSRMGAYHRLDIALQFHKEVTLGERTISVSVYNVYNRQNPFFYYISENSKGEKVLKQISIFPIIPSVSYTLKF
ncbi:MAG: TonB-dependent receptor [Bacteroidales bacterium]|nr:TonB-dependent receptor [Bacteroidales bacterium]MCF8328171.1 TonB-dependent receptor [Bacteroidales bacterium]